MKDQTYKAIFITSFYSALLVSLIFNFLAPGIKQDLELEKRFITEETKSNLKNLKQDIEKSKDIIKRE